MKDVQNSSRRAFHTRVKAVMYASALLAALIPVSAQDNTWHRPDSLRAIHRSADIYNHLPSYHFYAPENKLNDPNGLCFWKGRWHMFYQAYPFSDPRQHWGHAVSSDMVHWEDLPLAITPGPEEYVYSGGTFVEDDRVIATYYGRPIGEMIAISSDSLLLNWNKVTGQPVIKAPEESEGKPYRTFDPYIWKQGKYYYLISGNWNLKGPGGRRFPTWFLFRSKDLEHWQYRHEFVEGDSYSLVGDDGACPYFVPIGKDKYLLIHFSHKSGACYLIGDYDVKREKFVVTGGGRINNAPVGNGGFHAPSAYSLGDGSVVVIYNTKSNDLAKGTYTTCMTLPSRLTLDEKGDLCVSAYGGYESLRSECVELKDIALPAGEEIVLDGIAGTSMELEMEFDAKASSVEVDVLRDPQAKEYTRLVFYRNRGYADRSIMDDYHNKRNCAFMIDPSYSSSSPKAAPRVPEVCEVRLNDKEPLKLHIFIDRSIVEVFINDRQYTMLRVWPVGENSTGVSVRSRTDANLKEVRAWQMGSIYTP